MQGEGERDRPKKRLAKEQKEAEEVGRLAKLSVRPDPVPEGGAGVDRVGRTQTLGEACSGEGGGGLRAVRSCPWMGRGIPLPKFGGSGRKWEQRRISGGAEDERRGTSTT